MKNKPTYEDWIWWVKCGLDLGLITPDNITIKITSIQTGNK